MDFRGRIHYYVKQLYHFLPFRPRKGDPGASRNLRVEHVRAFKHDELTALAIKVCRAKKQVMCFRVAAIAWSVWQLPTLRAGQFQLVPGGALELVKGADGKYDYAGARNLSAEEVQAVMSPFLALYV